VAVAAFVTLAGCAGSDLLRRDPSPSLAILRPQLSPFVEDVFPRAALPADPVEEAIFHRINLDRAQAGVPPVLWDEKAASLARAYTRRQIAERTMGHFLLDGVPPYARLSGQGDLGAGAENVGAFMTSAEHFWTTPLDLGVRGQDEMVHEMPPNDGHRRAILDPLATHVGVGWAISGGDFRMAEEFTTRGFDWLRVLRAGTDGSAIKVRGKALQGRSIEFVSVARQPFPDPMTREQVNSRRSYSYPEPTYALMPAASSTQAVGLKTFHCLVPSIQGKFSFEYQLDRPGLWTFVLYFQEKGSRKPYPGGSFSVWVG
jgi:uncharacterized protein YkwD